MDPYIGEDNPAAMIPGVNFDPSYALSPLPGQNMYPMNPPTEPTIYPPALPMDTGYFRQRVSVPRWAAIAGGVALVLLILRR